MLRTVTVGLLTTIVIGLTAGTPSAGPRPDSYDFLCRHLHILCR